MDQDGENNSFLTDGSDLVLTPRFSPNQREITYMSFYRETPRVYILHLDTGRREILGDFPGMTFAPRFSPDGNKVIMSLVRQRCVRDLPARPAHATEHEADRWDGDRYLALLFARRNQGHVQVRPLRQPSSFT